MTQDWHIDKSVSVGHLLTTVVIAVSVFMYFGKMDKQVSANAQSIEFLKEQRAEDLKRIEKNLDSISKKLDRIMQSQGL